ncbi:uncharacterized protein K460DRAFT_365986 [Cucurbitaria berberidis CBS 394.84]|uniref:Uncharacterized protein n=1 Tax=Cucurbitaria berberidis CBS 394.84 TaxID=1168544 RepID=A0A9P4GH18_9PLEO|nr:uncharacterized protein K460DRAFT_365986 [Cucurbitaria berberidis CBS 394.84]KAF1845094.1 hypothetical protein K460DRAFT_365986 [Cucurbitaria berberidis CBS 394.84]
MDSRASRCPTSMPPVRSLQSERSAKANFLSLPKGIRNSIYNEVLTLPCPLYLFQEPGSQVETFAPDRPSGWPAMLYINRQIHSEASAVLYRTNQFHLVDITQEQLNLLQSFLDGIGPVNAASLSHLCLNFPVVESKNGHLGKLKLRDDGLQSLKLLQDKCTNLSTLETLVHNKNAAIFRKTDDSLREALSLVDAQVKAIPSLKRVIVRFVVHDGVPTTSAKALMEGRGWVVISGDGNER